MTTTPDVATGMVARLTSYICTARDEPLSADLEDAALRCIYDLVAATVPGLADPGSIAVRSVAQTMGEGSCPIWFTGGTGSAIASAWANSAAASAMDLDDGHRLARGHPGAAVIPAALAVAAECGASPDAVLRAIVIGYEVGVTIGAARTSYGNTGTWSSYAVVATAAALRRTDRHVLEHALAIAGESAPNQLFASAPAPRIPAPEGSAVKEGIPWSVVTGLVALGLAEAGHTGPRNILDSATHYGFPEQFSIGVCPHICRSYFKLYACCRHVHAPVDAMLSLIAIHALTPGDISAVDVEAYGGALRISNRVRPVNLVDVQYSIPYCLGLVALRGASALLPLTSDALFHEDVSAFAERVTLRSHPDFDARFPAETVARVTVKHRGQLHESAVTSPRGDASAPLGWPDLEEKFLAASRFIATPEQQAQVIGAMAAARAHDFGPLTQALATLRLATSTSGH